MNPGDLWALHDSVRATLVDEELEVRTSERCACGASEPPVLWDGDRVCPRCFSVVERELDERPDFRGGLGADRAESAERCGPPTNPLFPGFATSSVIGYGGAETMRFARMRKYQMWSSLSYKDRSMYKVSEAMNTFAARGAFNAAILEDAKTLFSKASNAMVSRGEMRNGVIASCVFMACKRNHAPRSAKEIAEIFDTSCTTVTRGCKRLHDLLDIHDLRACEPTDFVRRFCARLSRPDLAGRVETLIGTVGANDAATDHCPTAVAATCVFMVGARALPPLSRREVADACGVAEVTIAKCAKKVAKCGV